MAEYTFDVVMTCSGCSNAVTRALKRVEGVNDIDANLETQKVTVKTNEDVTRDIVLAAIKKTGKEVKE